MAKILGIGETVLDIVFKNDQPVAAIPGGSTFNAIISLGRVGVPCVMVTEVGDDHVGDLTCAYLRENGVADTYVNRHPHTKSHLSLAFLDDANDAQYTFYKDHAHARLSIHPHALDGVQACLFGSFFAVNPVIRDVVQPFLQRAHDLGALLYYDINFRASHIDEIPLILPAIEQNMHLASLVRGSADDFRYLYGTEDVDTIYTHIAPHCPYFICTAGAKAISLRTPTLSLDVAVPTIPTVSTIGAGDNFNAGFLYEWAQRGLGKPACWTEPDWRSLIATGIRFAQDVCQRLENSIS